MNGEDDFERRLQSHPQQKLPASWRAEILTAAKVAAAHRLPTSAPVMSRLSALLWPAPRAWAGLAAAWLVVLTLNLSSYEPAGPDSANRVVPVSAQSREMLREQGELLAELVGPRSIAEAAKAPVSQPRSQRRQETSMT